MTSLIVLINNQPKIMKLLCRYCKISNKNLQKQIFTKIHHPILLWNFPCLHPCLRCGTLVPWARIRFQTKVVRENPGARELPHLPDLGSIIITWAVTIMNDLLLVIRDQSGYGLSQWETMLHCNSASQWLSPHPEWSLVMGSNTAQLALTMGKSRWP